jgi:hypothetical protein
MRIAISILIVAALSFACSKKEKHHHEKTGEWKELDSFHKVMAEAFHPLKDSGNLEPAKKLAAHLADEAAKWAASSLPEDVNNDQMKVYLEQLKSDSRSFADDIAKGVPDDVLKAKVIALHDQFHKIMEASQGGHHDAEEHERDHDDDEEDD